MINFTGIKSKNIFSLSAILLSALLLQACGGARDEPLNVSASSSSHGSSVTTTVLTSDSRPHGTAEKDAARILITDTDRLTYYWNKYSNKEIPDVAFDKGQVVLLDLGEKQACDRSFSYNNIKAYQESGGQVLVQFFFKKTSSSSSSSSSDSSSSSSSSSLSSSSSSSSSNSCGNTSIDQPYYFFYIESLDTLEYEESVD